MFYYTTFTFTHFKKNDKINLSDIVLNLKSINEVRALHL